MDVGPVPVDMGNRLVDMGMGMRFFRLGPFMGMGVVRVVDVCMAVREFFVGMEVPVLFPVEQDNASGHEQSGQSE